MYEYLSSSDFRAKIDALDGVEPMESPACMAESFQPKLHQLKGAAQIRHACLSEFRGMILADPMGLGKTLTTILALWLMKDVFGKFLIVCPAHLIPMWLRHFKEAFKRVGLFFGTVRYLLIFSRAKD